MFTIIKLLLFECDILSNFFLIIATTIAILTTFAYKAQALPYYSILSPKQERLLIIYIVVATILKLIALIHKNVFLTLTKTFFIDWEPPHTTNGKIFTTNDPEKLVTNISNSAAEMPETKVYPGHLSRKTIVSDFTPPVIWRTYLVANEWNELQNYRKTSISVQLITMLVLLEWVNMKNWAYVAPGFSTEENVTYSSTVMTRYAINAILYLIVAYVQWMFCVIIIERIIVDPFHNIIDLCSIANISILSLTHPLHGYYIHGRSVHGRADTNMAEMNLYLKKERDNLCAERGLEPGKDLQTYVVNLPKALKSQFDETVKELNDARLRSSNTKNFDATTAKIDKIAQVHSKMNRLLMDFIDHCNSTADYTIKEPTLLESFLDIEFTDTTQLGSFVRDKSEMAFSGAFVYGNEWIHLSFEMLLFCCTHMAFNNYTLSAFLTIAVSKIIHKFFALMFTNNLIRSSLIDQRFLI